ncbi:HAD family hydrolase [Candidatus Woesearchaeota archaeon]|nr:HAD family hydrolase [Candidatus Woesearchaeota archaeon]
MAVKFIIFDFDDTLENFRPFYDEITVSLIKKIADKYELDAGKVLKIFDKLKNKIDIPRRRPTVAHNRKVWFFYLLKKLKVISDSEQLEKEAESLKNEYWKIMNNKVELFPKTKEVLDKLKKKYSIVILSSSDGELKIKLDRIEKLGITGYFDGIYTTDNPDISKPHFIIYKNILEKHGFKPDETLVVGDHPRWDLKVPKRLGMTTVWTQEAFKVDKTLRYVDYTINKIEELPGLIERINNN